MPLLSEPTCCLEDVAPATPASEAGVSFSVVHPGRVTDWDQAVLGHPDGHFFHSSAWAAVLTEAFGFKPCYLMARQHDEVAAMVPLMEVRTGWTGTRGVGLPFTDECPPLSAAWAGELDLFQRAVALGQARQWRRLEWRGGRPVVGDAPASVSFYKHQLDLSGGKEATFTRFTGAIRRGIRKAQEAAIVVTVSHSLESLQRFHALYCLTRKRQGLPPQSFSFFRSMHRHVIEKKMGFVVEAFCRQAPVAGAVFFTLGRKAVYKYGASDKACQSLRANNLVLWEAIQWLIARGFESLHLGRTSIAHEGLRRFKNGWGGEESRIEYFRFDLRHGKFEQEKDRSSGWHNALFRLLPVPLARAIGYLAYKHTA